MKRTSGKMDQDLVEEIEYMEELLTKSGFFSADEILEIMEDQFIDEDIDFSDFNFSLKESSNENFSRLEKVFSALKNEKIVCSFEQ